MTTLHVVSLLLAVSGALNVGCAVGAISVRSGSHPLQAVLAGASAAGTVVALFLAAVSAYR